MQIGMIGLGRMGSNMVRRLLKQGHECIVYSRGRESREKLAAEGAIPASSIEDFVAKLTPPRAIWLMIPAASVDAMLADLLHFVKQGDLIVDGGNSFYRDDIRRARELQAKGIHYADVGTSGGVWGLERGYCLMIGGDEEVVERLHPVFAALAPGKGSVQRTPGRDGGERTGTAELGYLHCGPSGYHAAAAI